MGRARLVAIAVLAVCCYSPTRAFRTHSHPAANKALRWTQHQNDIMRLRRTCQHRDPARTVSLYAVEKADPSILVKSQDDNTQRLAVVLAGVGLALGTNLCINLWHGAAAHEWLGASFYQQIRTQIFPLLLGGIFAGVGVLHFVLRDNFARIVPPRGTWGGWWQAPAPGHEQLGISYELYHTYWSGLVECVGGLWLLAGGLHWTSPTTTPAVLLFLLTVGVTPANLYMFTHDAEPGGPIPPLPYPSGHVARFVLQCGLLSNFWIMAVS